ncbi:MAG: aspartate kinase [Clostridiaceae bacterium]|nr:aspartate kinase [Clostridiaceae bacterium]
MRIIVQKFGGTSVASRERRNMVIDKVVCAVEQGYSPVVVVSAMGRKGDPYATDSLLSLINSKDCNVEKREADLLMSCGEIISAVVMAEAFAERGYKTRVLTGGNAGIITDSNFGNAGVINVEAEKVLKVLEQGLIPIVTGFQGMTEEGDYTTLGRGGSDVTGALLGKALNAEYVEIYTDVDGIMTADPNIVPNARIIDRIDYREVFQLAYQGAKVIHPRAVEYALEDNIPLIVKNTFSDAPGTVITNLVEYEDNLFTGVTSMTNKAMVIVNFSEAWVNKDRDIFELLKEEKISIDIISEAQDQTVFIVDSDAAAAVEAILKQAYAEYRIIDNCSKIFLIGNKTNGMQEVMSKLVKTLEVNNVNVLQIATSHRAICCLIGEADNKKALNELHNAFFCAS